MPLGDVTASDIRDLKRPGLMLPIAENDSPYLVVEQGGTRVTMALEGNQAFLFYPISLKTPRSGLFVPEPKILVDFSSATEGGALSDQKGTLILSEDSLCVIANHASGMGEPQCLPLWQTISGGSDAVKVAFTRWGLGLRQGDTVRTLWERRNPAPSFYVNLD